MLVWNRNQNIQPITHPKDSTTMQCRYCSSSYKLTKWHNDKNACPDCDGITDNLAIEDDELQLDIWNLKHPSGKTEAVFEYDEYTDI